MTFRSYFLVDAKILLILLEIYVTAYCLGSARKFHHH